LQLAAKDKTDRARKGQTFVTAGHGGTCVITTDQELHEYEATSYTKAHHE